MFEKASRMKLRFNSGKGLITVEDLWNLPLMSTGANLDTIARILARKLKDREIDSFVAPACSGYSATRFKLDIVKHIINVRLAEADKNQQDRIDAQYKNKVKAAIARIEDSKLDNMKKEDLEKLL